MIRVGIGYDSHRFAAGGPMVLGGIRFESSVHLAGHSDGDAVCHALTDAILGAAGLGDIGRHFPDTDVRFKGADSKVLLAEAMNRVRAAGWHLVNVDATVVAQAPKLASHMPAMVDSVANCLGVSATRVNLKAKTAERLGPVGQGLSLEARAVALLTSVG